MDTGIYFNIPVVMQSPSEFVSLSLTKTNSLITTYKTFQKEISWTIK